MVIFNNRCLIYTIAIMMLPAGAGIAQEITNAKSSNTNLGFGSRLSFETQIEQSIGADRNFDLDDEDKEGKLDLEPSAEFAITYTMSKDTFAYLSLQYGRELEIEEENRERSYESTLELDEGYVEFNDIFGIDDLIKKTSLTVGRFNVSDNREWYYDKNVDGILVSFELEPIDTKFSLSVNREELIGSDLLGRDKFDPVNNFIVVAEHEPFKDIDMELAAYAIVRNDRSDDNESPRFYGFSTNGKLADKRFRFWTDFALARGNDDDKKIKGYGLDVGATMSLNKNHRQYLTLGYAFGSGGEDTDTDFRQTDLHGNSDKFGGVASFKYYGELLDPELSNLHILTAGIGFRFSSTASIDFIMHHYRQDESLDELRKSDLNTDPNGDDRKIGNELDIVLGFNLASNVETEFTVGYFQPGAAFDDDASDAFMLDAKLSYKF